MVVAFVDAHRDRFGVEPICRVLREQGVGIAPSTYYAARSRPPSARAVRDAELAVEVARVHGAKDIGRGVYGYRKVWHHLGREGRPVARCTVARLMREQGLAGAVRGRRFVRTTVADPVASRPPDLVKRGFAAPAPNRLWVVDFTYVPTWSGMAYTAFVIDVFSRRVVGWRCASSMTTDLPLDALEMSLFTRAAAGADVTGVVHHSDAGSQYTAIRYAARLAEAGALASIGTVGDSYDNALAESTIGLYKTECVGVQRQFRTVADLELATSDWVHWYNTARLHAVMDYRTPAEVEAAHEAALQVARDDQQEAS